MLLASLGLLLLGIPVARASARQFSASATGERLILKSQNSEGLYEVLSHLPKAREIFSTEEHYILEDDRDKAWDVVVKTISGMISGGAGSQSLANVVKGSNGNLLIMQSSCLMHDVIMAKPCSMLVILFGTHTRIPDSTFISVGGKHFRIAGIVSINPRCSIGSILSSVDDSNGTEYWKLVYGAGMSLDYPVNGGRLAQNAANEHFVFYLAEEEGVVSSGATAQPQLRDSREVVLAGAFKFGGERRSDLEDSKEDVAPLEADTHTKPKDDTNINTLGLAILFSHHKKVEGKDAKRKTIFKGLVEILRDTIAGRPKDSVVIASWLHDLNRDETAREHAVFATRDAIIHQVVDAVTPETFIIALELRAGICAEDKMRIMVAGASFTAVTAINWAEGAVSAYLRKVNPKLASEEWQEISEVTAHCGSPNAALASSRDRIIIYRRETSMEPAGMQELKERSTAHLQRHSEVALWGCLSIIPTLVSKPYNGEPMTPSPAYRSTFTMANASFHDADVIISAVHTYSGDNLVDATGNAFGSIAIDTSRRGMGSSLMQVLPKEVKVIGLSFASSDPIPSTHTIKPAGQADDFILYSIMTISPTDSLAYVTKRIDGEAIEWHVLGADLKPASPPPGESVMSANQDRIAFYVWAGLFK